MRISYRTLLAFLCLALGMAACDSSNSVIDLRSPPPQSPAMATFDVTVSNLTNGQPLSPVAVIAHADGYNVFTLGTAATAEVELLAESGDNTELLAKAEANANVLGTASGAAPIGPAGEETIQVQVFESDVPNLRISTLAMLVNTNDAFTALDAADLSDQVPGDTWSTRTVAYDAGTEANTELAAHVPGPAGGGEGFNNVRDDVADRVAMHAGVVSRDDGFDTSNLTGQHRFDNPVAVVRIERVN